MKKKILLIILFILIIPSIYFFTNINKTSEVEIKEEETVVEKEPEKKTMSLVMVGDALIHGAVYQDAHVSGDEYDFKEMFTLIKDEIKDYDLKYYNQETIIGGKNLGVSHYPLFNSPDEIGLDLIDAGFNMVSLATNHSLDKGETGILYSTNFWKSQEDVVISGTNLSEEDRNDISIYEKNGIKYAFISYTVSTNGLSVPDGKDYLLNVYSDEQAKIDIEKVRDDVDVVIVAMHWGEEYYLEPVQSQKDIATYLSSLGVNLIIGAHPHVIEPIGYVNDTLVIYSLGNFISAQHPLGLDKTIGLMVGLDIVVEDGKVTFENINKELLYTYCTSSYTNFKVYPFSKLDDSILNNYKQIEEEYMEIVNSEVIY